MQSWLFLHFPNLQLDALFSQQTDLAITIVDNKRFTVKQCNQLAASQGIKLGMGLGSASALCQDLQVHPYDAIVEQQTLSHIAQWLYSVTSDICLYPPQSLLLKVTDMLSLYGGLESYWQQLSAHLQRLNLNFSYSMGFSPLSAMMLAKADAQLLTLDKELLQQAIASFPIQAAELPSKQIEKLARVGIATIQDLIDIPVQELARRFDIELVNYVGRLMGQFRHPIDFYHPPEKFVCYQELLFDIENIQWLEKPLTKLLEKLEQFLLMRNQVGYELVLVLHQRDHQDGQVQFSSASGDYLASRWLTLCKLTLESLQLEAPVQGLTLKLHRSGELESSSVDLFKGVQGAQTSLELIGLLQAKLGKSCVHKVAHSDDPRPENATTLSDPTLTHTKAIISQRLRPNIILPKPEALTEKVSLMQGPERIASGWWDGNEVVRDYFIARGHTGRWLWIFRTQQKQWFIHGLFS